jgi:hypothetical protein
MYSACSALDGVDGHGLARGRAILILRATVRQREMAIRQARRQPWPMLRSCSRKRFDVVSKVLARGASGGVCGPSQ